MCPRTLKSFSTLLCVALMLLSSPPPSSVGSYEDDKPCLGTLISPRSTYSGTFLNWLFHGTGCNLALSDGTTYHGEFWHGRCHGAGRLTFPDGTVYLGEFAEGERHGTGSILAVDGYSYSGDWVRGKREGEGAETLLDGRGYQGQFRSDQRHGAGTATDPGGATREGTWRDGEPADGPGWSIVYADGSKYVGCAVRSEPHGVGTMRYSHGRGGGGIGVYNGEFRDGKRNGSGVCVYSSGETFDGIWADDKPLTEAEAHKGAKGGSVGGSGNTGGMTVGQLLEHIQHAHVSELIIEAGSQPSAEDAAQGSPISTLPNGESRKHPQTTISRFSISLKSEVEEALLLKEVNKDEKHPLHKYSNDDTFQGYIDKNGYRQGRGLFREAASGIEYDGNFLDNMKHGHGVEVTASAKYNGAFQFDRREGWGTLVLQDLGRGSTYQGQFKNGTYQGRGTLCDSDGWIYTGDFVRGLKEGSGEELSPDDSVYNGQFKAGKRN